MIRHNKCALHQTILIFRKFGRGIKLSGNRIKGGSGNEIGDWKGTGLVGRVSQGWGQSQICLMLVL